MMPPNRGIPRTRRRDAQAKFAVHRLTGKGAPTENGPKPPPGTSGAGPRDFRKDLEDEANSKKND